MLAAVVMKLDCNEWERGRMVESLAGKPATGCRDFTVGVPVEPPLVVFRDSIRIIDKKSGSHEGAWQ